MIPFVNHAEVNRTLDWAALIAEIEALLARRPDVPDRTPHTIALPDGETASLLMMPAWVGGESLGVKLVTFFPGNGNAGLPTLTSIYIAFNGRTGQVAAVIDGEALTARRTAATSALASRHLSRQDARRLLVIGTGQLAPSMAMAHASVRRFEVIEIFGRDPKKAAFAVEALARGGIDASVAHDLEASARCADVISCATSAMSPVLHGDWLKEGAHIDLVGSFRADMRESDDAVMQRSSIFVDTRAGALLAGDLQQPIAAGTIDAQHILADLGELVRGQHPGRRDEREITVFKSAGSALQDLAAARKVIEGHHA